MNKLFLTLALLVSFGCTNAMQLAQPTVVECLLHRIKQNKGKIALAAGAIVGAYGVYRWYGNAIKHSINPIENYENKQNPSVAYQYRYNPTMERLSLTDLKKLEILNLTPGGKTQVKYTRRNDILVCAYTWVNHTANDTEERFKNYSNIVLKWTDINNVRHLTAFLRNQNILGKMDLEIEAPFNFEVTVPQVPIPEFTPPAVNPAAANQECLPSAPAYEGK